MIVRILLAAGAGRRMGATKALLDLGGRTALERIAGLDGPGRPMSTLVVTGHDREAVEAEARRLGLETVHNARWDEGQTGSVQTGLRALPAEASGFLLHPVDLPLVAPATQRAVVEAWLGLEDRESRIAVASHGMRRGHPAVFGRRLVAEFLGLAPDEPARSVMRARAAAIEHVEVDDPWTLDDLDTPDDLERARRHLASG